MVEFNELGIQHCLCAKHRTRDQEEIPREQDMSILKEARAHGRGRRRSRSSVGYPERTGCQEAAGPWIRGT